MSEWYEFFAESDFQTNSDSFHVSSAGRMERSVIHNYGQPDQYTDTDIRFQYTQNIQNPSSMVDLTKYLPSGGRGVTNADFTYVYNDVFTYPQPLEYFNTEIYEQKKELMRTNVGWIVGDADNPGMCVFRNSDISNSLTLYIINGFFKRTDIEGETDYYGYGLQFGGSYNIQIAQKVFFTFDADRMAEDVAGLQKYLRLNYRANLNDENYGTAIFTMFDPTAIPNFAYLAIDGLTSFDIYTTIDTKYESGFLISDPIYPSNVCWGNFSDSPLWSVGYINPSNLAQISPSAMDDADTPTEDNPYSGGGIPATGGGNGDYPEESDNIDIPDPTGLPSLTSSGLVKLYNPSASELQEFTDFLFDGITESIENTIKKLTTEPLQYVIGLYLTRFAPTVTASTTIKFAGVSTGATAAIINNEFQQLNCGYLDIPNASKSHLDYSPFSSAVIYLPYIGYRDLNIDEVMGSRLYVKYNIDLVTGSCTAFVKVVRTKRMSGDANISATLYEFEGNCFVQCPLSSKDSSGTIQALSQFAGAVGSAAGGNVGGTIGGMVSAISTEKVGVSRNGSPASNYGYASHQKPFVILQRPINHVPTNFEKFEGWTSNMRRRIGSLKGYTEIDSNTLWTDNMSCTQEEADEIRELFNNGVYL